MLMLALARDLVYDDHWGVVAFCPFGPSALHSSIEVTLIIVQLSVPRKEVLGLHDYAECYNFSNRCAFFSFWKNIYALVGCTHSTSLAMFSDFSTPKLAPKLTRRHLQNIPLP